MMRSGSPLPRPASPAISEISVGSPSPPLAPALHNLSQHNGLTAFRPLSIKRARLTENISQQSTVLTTDNGVPLTIRLPPQAPQRRKSSAERVKSFSIADILGKRDTNTPKLNASRTPTPPTPAAPPLPPPEPAIAPLALNSSSSIVETSIMTALPTLPRPQPALPATLLPTQILGERLGPTLPPPSAALIVPPTQLLLDAHVFPKWQAIRGAAAATAVPMPLRPFLPPALLHYEQRLAWDYQRQLQEHFQAQAQLLRQMSMDPSIIPSEDGSERSHSTSTGSECCSPDLGGEPNKDGQSNDKTCTKEWSENDRKNGEANDGGKAQKSTGDTPLDALFQLSTKNFDDGTDPATLDIFSTRPNPKKKRKSRTAFTNHQIFELEKRFLYQKYLSPADRDEIAASLGLSNAQVITWFQNRRAKLKRDMEELKKDVESAKQLPDQSADISSQQYQSACRQRLQQHQQHLMASLNNHRNLVHHHHHHHHQMLPISPLSCLQSQSPTQQQQQQQQHSYQHNNNNNNNNKQNNVNLKPEQLMYPLTLQATTNNDGATAATMKTRAPTHTQPTSQSYTNSTAAEDKKELKMLKMMTLMYYTSRAQADASACGDAFGAGSRAVGSGNGHSNGVGGGTHAEETAGKTNVK